MNSPINTIINRPDANVYISFIMIDEGWFESIIAIHTNGTKVSICFCMN